MALLRLTADEMPKAKRGEYVKCEVEAIIYEKGKKKSTELLGRITVDKYDRVSIRSYRRYLNITKYIAGERRYELRIDGKEVMLLFEKGKYAYLGGRK